MSRIKQLKAHCMTVSGDYSFPTTNGFDADKFAELLIGDCLHILKSAHDSWDNPGSYETAEWYRKCEAKADVLDDMISEIKAHFQL